MAAGFDDMDVIAERIGTYLQRLAAVSAHAVVHSHLTYRDMGNVIMM